MDTDHSANGYWRKQEDVAARGLVTGERRILAIHHPPEPDAERTIVGQLTGGFAFGFPPGTSTGSRSSPMRSAGTQSRAGSMGGTYPSSSWTSRLERTSP